MPQESSERTEYSCAITPHTGSCTTSALVDKDAGTTISGQTSSKLSDSKCSSW